MPPSTFIPARLQELFVRFVQINAVSLAEKAMAEEVRELLLAAGISVREDDAGHKLNGNTGNLVCLPPDYDPHAPALVLSAHLDTVQPTAGLRPQIDATRICSAGDTILGADNRLGVTVLVHLLLTLAQERFAHKNFLVVFTVAEEIGMLGANCLELAEYNIRSGFVFDCSRRPGVYIRECAGAATFQAKFLGKAAHAGVAPEHGVNAIALASKALARIPTGRIDADTTANFGKIFGGGPTNVVPDLVTVEGEVRSFSPQRLQQQLALIERNIAEAVAPHGRFEFTSQSDFAPYVLAPDSPAVVALEKALVAVGLTPEPIRYMGGSDANAWNAKGIPTVNIGIGAQKPHTFEEYVLLEDLVKSAEIAFALIQPD